MTFTQEQFYEAMKFAIDAHRGQKRRGDSRPYILHPIAVMTTLYDIKKSRHMFLLGACALLHDVVEDCGITLQELADKFGHTLAGIVEELTNNKKELKQLGKLEYLKQKMETMSSYALIIKLCDRYDNVKDLSIMDRAWSLQYAKDTEAILQHITQSRKLTQTHTTIMSLIYQRISEWKRLETLKQKES